LVKFYSYAKLRKELILAKFAGIYFFGCKRLRFIAVRFARVGRGRMAKKHYFCTNKNK
jgi:hypothetical protein